MYRTPEVAFALAVNNTQLIDPFLQAGVDIFGYQAAQFFRAEGVQIERAIYRQLFWMLIRI